MSSAVNDVLAVFDKLALMLLVFTPLYTFGVFSCVAVPAVVGSHTDATSNDWFFLFFRDTLVNYSGFVQTVLDERNRRHRKMLETMGPTQQVELLSTFSNHCFDF
jgi:hypothetical protein